MENPRNAPGDSHPNTDIYLMAAYFKPADDILVD
ncbi:uncharacterized protein METZ01_LOCUS78985 [marine metagenome]|uniref:Uncharacterized protein n=1 Tax=marine metagenome TaxID=408172 RepID=A0A381UEG2_9ZZZZ